LEAAAVVAALGTVELCFEDDEAVCFWEVFEVGFKASTCFAAADDFEDTVDDLRVRLDFFARVELRFEVGLIVELGICVVLDFVDELCLTGDAADVFRLVDCFEVLCCEVVVVCFLLVDVTSLAIVVEALTLLSFVNATEAAFTFALVSLVLG